MLLEWVLGIAAKLPLFRCWWLFLDVRPFFAPWPPYLAPWYPNRVSAGAKNCPKQQRVQYFPLIFFFFFFFFFFCFFYLLAFIYIGVLGGCDCCLCGAAATANSFVPRFFGQARFDGCSPSSGPTSIGWCPSGEPAPTLTQQQSQGTKPSPPPWSGCHLWCQNPLGPPRP
jgi:hypothetical protein